jgi:hypothetical protein
MSHHRCCCGCCSQGATCRWSGAGNWPGNVSLTGSVDARVRSVADASCPQLNFDHSYSAVLPQSATFPASSALMSNCKEGFVDFWVVGNGDAGVQVETAYRFVFGADTPGFPRSLTMEFLSCSPPGINQLCARVSVGLTINDAGVISVAFVHHLGGTTPVPPGNYTLTVTNVSTTSGCVTAVRVELEYEYTEVQTTGGCAPITRDRWITADVTFSINGFESCDGLLFASAAPAGRPGGIRGDLLDDAVVRRHA